MESGRLQYVSDRDCSLSQRASMLEILDTRDQQQEDECNGEDESKTTYESCSSFNSDDDQEQQNHQHQYLNMQTNDAARKTTDQNQSEDETLRNVIQKQQFRIQNDFTQQNQDLYMEASLQQQMQQQYTIETDEAPQIKNKTLKLSSIKEGKLIYFEEYDPLNQSHRNEAMMTGGRGTSCASNSNRFSLSKTINFNMAFLNPSGMKDHSGLLQKQTEIEKENTLTSLNSSLVDLNNQRSTLNELLDSNLSERQLETRQNMGTQTFILEEVMKNGVSQMTDQINSQRQLNEAYRCLSDNEKVLMVNELSQSFNNNIEGQLPSHMFPLSARARQHSYRAQSQDTNSSPFSKHEQTVNFLNQSMQRHTQNHNSLLQRSSAVHDRVKTQGQNTNGITNVKQQHNIQRTFTYNEANDEPSNHKNHERKWSESSNSNQNQLSQGLNGPANVSFSKTMNVVNINNKQKRKEDETQDLKYLLENVQCEAKNLKLLLNLKDDQMQLYESKAQELNGENEEIHRQLEEYRSKLDILEEEVMYLRAVANNSMGEQVVPVQKQSVFTVTESIKQDSKSCQVMILHEKPAPLQHKLNIALSPIRMQFSPQKISSSSESNHIQIKLKKQLAESEKENFNLLNKLNTGIEKCKKQDLDYNILQTDYNMLQKESGDMRKQMQQDNNNLYWQLENQKAQMSDKDQKMREVFQLLEESKHQTKKKSSKIKCLKKERDVLKIEILKLRQIYSDKCDNYKEVRTKLQKKLKKREHIIGKLEDKLVTYEHQYQKQQNQSKVVLPSWAQGQEIPVQEFESSNQFMKSSMRSRSLENTGNFNSTAKHHMKNIHQNLPVREVSKEHLVQEYIVQTPNQNKQQYLQQHQHQHPHYGYQHQISSSNAYDEYSRQQQLNRLKSHHLYKQQQQQQTTVEEERDKHGRQQHPGYSKGNHHYPITSSGNHFVSGDKSKSFYSSEFDNNTLFDPNQIIMEDQSNSSNYYSNINNSNSHLFIDESALMSEKHAQQNYGYVQQQVPPQTEMKYKKPGNQQQHHQQQQQQMVRVSSTNQMKPSQIPMPSYAIIESKKKSHQPTSKVATSQVLNKHVSHLSSHKRRNDSNILSNNHTPVNHSYLSSLQPDDNINNQNNISNSNIPQRCVTKSPLCKGKAQKQQDPSMIQRNRSSQNLSQGGAEQQMNTNNTQQNTIRNHHQPVESTTSSNRNINQQVKIVGGRPQSSSSTNNTATTHHHNQAAMISYQSSSSGGSKNYQSKLILSQKQQY